VALYILTNYDEERNLAVAQPVFTKSTLKRYDITYLNFPQPCPMRTLTVYQNFAQINEV
jgi:hypothetical protein